ncbi:hypothetical protein FA15DRAFT_665310 [Coprinopsis marcescibilis]|uniref:Ribosomal protein/NADH dehydrogenase domain-containing protein n=1 Tax=Coprinopsis marcescibilis TaxID=230819 RepID=A0A5C3L6J3_COPMA|nr:hypothetical protein FA15DRAFT_665310 [Coprinopsis marcescibilis]
MASTLKSAAAQAPSKLSKILTHLNASPRLQLEGVKSLRMSYAFRNDHFGARHFAKEQLPRIRWANPSLDIQVEKAKKLVTEEWSPELEIEFTNGTQKTLSLSDKWSTTIVAELMELAGGAPWKLHKAESRISGAPLVPGEESAPKPRPAKTALPSLHLFRETNPKTTPTPKQSAPAKRARSAKVTATASS